MTQQRGHGTSRMGQNLTMDDYNIEVVESFKYLGEILNVTNHIEEELSMRILQANKSFYSLKKLLTNRLLSRQYKYELYKTLIRSIATYDCETRTLTEQQEQKLEIFERKILRLIIGAVREEECTWRKRTNSEIYKNCSIVSYIKSQRIQWAGHVARMDENRVVKRVSEGKMNSTRAQGRPRLRWQDNVESDLRRIGIGNNWRNIARDRSRWKAVVESAKVLRS
jgi:hypothetical protein